MRKMLAPSPVLDRLKYQRRLIVGCVVLALQLLADHPTAGVPSAAAQGWTTTVHPGPQLPELPPEPKPVSGSKHVELWTGADGFRRVWSTYAGATIAPFDGILDEGFRLRVIAGYGGYQFSGKQSNVFGRVAFVNVLTGYHVRYGDLTLKTFAGGMFADNRYAPYRPVETGAARLIGMTSVFEAWLNLPRDGFISADIGYASVMTNLSIRSRAGLAVMPTVTAGVEGARAASLRNHPIRDEFGNIGAIKPEMLRLGVFTRMPLIGGEFDVAGGWSRTRDQLQTKGAVAEPYASVSWLTRF